MINVAILEDHPIVIKGYEAELEKSREINLVGAVLYSEELMPLLAKHRVDVLILDIEVKISHTNNNIYPFFTLLKEVFDAYPEINILVISSYTSGLTVYQALTAGATGYLFKDDLESMNHLVDNVLQVAQKTKCISRRVTIELETFKRRRKTKRELTKRQIETLSLCNSYPELTMRQIAIKMAVAPSTVRNLLSDSYDRLEVTNIKSAIAKFQELGYAPRRIDPFSSN